MAALTYFITHYPEEWERELEWRRTGEPTVLIPKPPVSTKIEMDWEEMVAKVNNLADDGKTTKTHH